MQTVTICEYTEYECEFSSQNGPPHAPAAWLYCKTGEDISCDLLRAALKPFFKKENRYYFKPSTRKRRHLCELSTVRTLMSHRAKRTLTPPLIPHRQRVRQVWQVVL